MFSSDPDRPESTEIQEFQFPGWDDLAEPPSPLPYQFQSWNYAPASDEASLDQEALRGAEAILRQAHEKAEEIARQAYEQGFQQGQKDGQEMEQRGLQEMTQRLQGLAASLEQDRERLFRQREEVLLELALLVCDKLIARELSLHPEAIRQIIEAGFRAISLQEGLRLWVSPPDYEILKQQDLDSWPRGVELAADGAITPGGFRLETGLGEVDGRRETRWTLVQEAIQSALETLDAQAAAP